MSVCACFVRGVRVFELVFLVVSVGLFCSRGECVCVCFALGLSRCS